MDTYEFLDRKTPLETYEWDDVWFEKTGNGSAKRVLYIGDSISVWTRKLITKRTKDDILCDGYATSKALDNPYFTVMIGLQLAQQNRCDGVLFNNGLHGWHLSDEEYLSGYENAVKFILSKTKAPLYILLTTTIKGDRNDRVIKKNEFAKSVANKYNLKVIDLYDVSQKNIDLLSDDGVHFLDEGYELFAQEIINNL
jgi:hypothetical protein